MHDDNFIKTEINILPNIRIKRSDQISTTSSQIDNNMSIQLKNKNGIKSGTYLTLYRN